MTSVKQFGRAVRPFSQLVVLFIVAATVLSACGSSSTPTTSTTSGTKTTTAHKTHSATPASCTTPLLSLTASFGGAAAGGSYYRFNAENTGPSSCSIDGYPSLTFFAPGAAGGAGSTTPVTLTTYVMGTAPTNM